jgi:hypothetical protein
MVSTDIITKEKESEQSEDQLKISKIIKQLKHYFSDANLNFDTFMRQRVKEKEGCKCIYEIIFV